MGATISEPPPALQNKEAGSSSMAMSVPSTPLVERPQVLNDDPKVDAWLGLMEKRGAINELVAFFYDSLSSMMGQMGEFFDL